MSILRTILIFCALVLPCPVAAGPSGEANSEVPPAPAELYKALKNAASSFEARELELRLYAWWAHTESPSESLIFEQANTLVARGDFAHAREKLDGLTAVAPDYVEGWNLRALVNLELDDYALAVSDLKRVLEIEPNHFRALSLLGAIFEQLDDPKSALKAYKAAMKINPHLEGGAESVRRLTDKVKGRGI